MGAAEVEAQITFVFVADLTRSAEFYGTTLGLELARDQGPCQIYRVTDGAYLGLCDHHPPEPSGIIVTLVTDDVDGWAARLTNAGVPIEGPTASEHFAIYHLFARDPDGYVIEIQRFDDPL